MVGSPNYIFMVYDADQSSFPAPEGVPIPEGRRRSKTCMSRTTPWSGSPTTTPPSTAQRLPGVHRGRDPVRGPVHRRGGDQGRGAAGSGAGSAGEQFDPCYHLACDTFENVDLHALEVNSDLIAFAQLTFAYSTESVNGVQGKRVPGPPVNLPPPAGPEGTFVERGRRTRVPAAQPRNEPCSF